MSHQVRFRRSLIARRSRSPMAVQTCSTTPSAYTVRKDWPGKREEGVWIVCGSHEEVCISIRPPFHSSSLSLGVPYPFLHPLAPLTTCHWLRCLRRRSQVTSHSPRTRRWPGQAPRINHRPAHPATSVAIVRSTFRVPFHDPELFLRLGCLGPYSTASR